MKNPLQAIVLVVFAAAALTTIALPAVAQKETTSNQQQQTRPFRHGKRWHGMEPGGEGFMFGCPWMITGQETAKQDQGFPGPGPGRGMIIMQEMMKPEANDSPEVTKLKQEMQAQHEKLIATRNQMHADCQHMHELLMRLRELKGNRYKGVQSPKNKGNAAPFGPAMNNKTDSPEQ